MCMWSPTYVIILWPAEWHCWPTRLHELCNLAMHPNHQCPSYVEATYVPGWKGRIVRPWTTGTSMLHCLPMKWTSSPDTLLTFMSVWDSGTNEWLSRVPGMARVDTNRSMSAAVTKKNIICWILHTHTPVKQMSHWQDLPFQWTLKACANAASCLTFPLIPSHVFLPWLVTKKFHSQSSPKSSRWWQIFAKFFKFVYSASLGKSCIHVHV